MRYPDGSVSCHPARKGCLYALAVARRFRVLLCHGGLRNLRQENPRLATDVNRNVQDLGVGNKACQRDPVSGTHARPGPPVTMDSTVPLIFPVHCIVVPSSKSSTRLNETERVIPGHKRRHIATSATDLRQR